MYQLLNNQAFNVVIFLSKAYIRVDKFDNQKLN